MAGARRTRILDVLARGDAPGEALDRLCRACVEELGVTGAGLTLLIAGQHRGTLCASDARTAEVEELQFTLGEGPCHDAHRSRCPVLEPGLAASTRWPAFGPGAVAAGVAAVFAVPLQLGAACFGTLDMYRDAPGPLGEGMLADAVVVADAATIVVMRVQAHAPPGVLPEVLEELADQRAAVHQAAGRVSVQLDVTMEAALVALRARAYAEGRSVGAVAADVVAGGVRFDR